VRQKVTYRIRSRILGHCRNRFRHQTYSRLYIYWTALLLSTCFVCRSIASLSIWISRVLWKNYEALNLWN